MSDWLEQYFGCDVGFDLNRIQGRNEPYPEPLQSLLVKCIESCQAPGGPCVLPVVTDGQQVDLLVAAAQAEQSTDLHGIAKAYLGSVYARVRNQIISKPCTNPQKHILNRFPGGIVHIRVPRGASDSKDYQSRVYKAIEVVLEFLEQYNSRPPMLSNVRRPTGRILRDFFVALRDQEQETGWRYFDELRRTGLLSARNQLFLEIQALAAFENWEAIVAHAKLRELLSGHVPRAVAVAFLLAADTLFLHQETLSSLNAGDVRKRLAPAVSFFSTTPDLGKDDENVRMWRTWAIGAALFGNIHGAEIVKERVGPSWLEQLFEDLELPVPEEKQVTAADNRLESLTGAPASVETAIELLKITLQGNEEQCRVIAEELNSYPTDIVDQLRLTPAIRTLLDSLLVFGEPNQFGGGWCQWLQEARQSPDPASLVRSAIEGAAHWSKTDWNEHDLNRVLDSGNIAVLQVLRDVLPILLDWLDRHEISLGIDCAESLLLNLALDDVSSVQDLSLVRDLLEIVLVQPHTRETYSSMLEAVQTIWAKIKSVHAVAGLCDVFDLLLEAPCASEAARQALWHDLQEFFLSNWKRLDNETISLARALSQDLVGSSDQFDIGPEEPEHELVVSDVNLSGKKVAIYSLMEKAAQRAKRVLEDLYPGINVVLNHDHTATSSLIHLSQSADYFVFASRAAKHQAFYPVTKQRSDIIYPGGKGTISIIRAISDTVTER